MKTEERSGQRERWRQIIGDQRSGGQSIAAFCRERGISEARFYGWRRRLSLAPNSPAWKRPAKPVSFALVETGTTATGAARTGLTLTLPGGELLGIGQNTDQATLRMVLEALRQPR